MRLHKALMAIALLPLIAAAEPTRVFDAMEDAALWLASASDGVPASSKAVPGKDGKAVRLDYDFGKVSGYAVLRRPVTVDFPANYRVSFWIRGKGGRNDFQVKFADASGDNVWWYRLTNFQQSEEWQQVSFTAGDVVFAWGPTSDKTLRKAAALEFVVARNRDGGAGYFEIDNIEIEPLPGEPVSTLPATTNENDKIVALAKAAAERPGDFPRAYSGQQPYWTLAGSDGGTVTALISEDGQIEPAKGSFSLEPFLYEYDGNRRYDWSNTDISQRLEDGDLPIPTVKWNLIGISFETTLLADSKGRGVLVGYLIKNIGLDRRKLTLGVAVRPFQVNPPAQFLSQQGGVSLISKLDWDGKQLAIAQPPLVGDPPVMRVLIPSSAPDRVAMQKGGELPSHDAPAASGIDDKAHLASAMLSYDLDLASGESRFVTFAVPVGQAPLPAWSVAHAETRAYWRDSLDRVQIAVPQDKQWLSDTVRSSLAHMLMSRAGPMLKPGTRSYNRAWIRDGAMIGEGLLRLGRPDVAREFATWYRGHLFANGKVPCCVDFRGADPVAENDSQGEYIFAVAELFRYTGDKAALEADWAPVLGAVRYMDQLRRSERTPANLSPERRMLYGLMPPSISHEGYSAKPQYSLWDDFWALRGYKDAADIAKWLGKPEAAEIAASRDEFAADLNAAITASVAHWNIDYIPGATSLGDFDATSTTIGLDPGGEQARLDPKLLANTFERYWNIVSTRRDSTAWNDYTPYELRNVSAFIRLGWRDRIDTLLAFFKTDRRPEAWNQWAEVVGRDPREIRFIGDMPHAWISSDFIRAALDMFAYENHDDHSLVLGAGLGEGWLTGKGSSIKGLVTPYGSIDFAMKGNAKKLSMTIGGTARPPGGFVLPWPYRTPPPVARINGRKAEWKDGKLLIRATGKPVKIEVGQ